jgi:hypothetical protein
MAEGLTKPYGVHQSSFPGFRRDGLNMVGGSGRGDPVRQIFFFQGLTTYSSWMKKEEA